MNTKAFAKLDVGDHFKLTYSGNGATHVVEVLEPVRPYSNGVHRMARTIVRSDDGTTFAALGWYNDDDQRELVDVDTAAIRKHVFEALRNAAANDYDLRTWPPLAVAGDLVAHDADLEDVAPDDIEPLVREWFAFSR